MKMIRFLPLFLVLAVAVTPTQVRGFAGLEDLVGGMAADAQMRPAALTAPAVAAPGEARLIKVAAGPAVNLDQLNGLIAPQLQPFNNGELTIKLLAKRMVLNATRAVWATFDASLEFAGNKVLVKDFDYFFAETPSGAPKFSGKATAQLDILKYQDKINSLAPMADRLVVAFAQEYLKDYRNAAVVDSKITDLKKDPKGNVTSLALTFTSRVTPSQLPTGVDPQSVLVLSGQATITATLSGAEVEFKGEFNPNARQFAQGQEGLKEIVEKILARNPRACAQIIDYVENLKNYVKRLMN